jgi:hypothetical protein
MLRIDTGDLYSGNSGEEGSSIQESFELIVISGEGDFSKNEQFVGISISGDGAFSKTHPTANGDGDRNC